MFRFSKTILCFILILAFLLPIINGFAQENLEEICQWEKIKEKPENLSNKDYESLLKKCQDYYQKISEDIEKDINRTEAEKNTLQNKIYILKNKIKSLDYQIYQGNIMIKDLTAQIGETQLSIDKTNLKIEDIKGNLSNLLQLRYEDDRQSSIIFFLSGKTLADLFDGLMTLEVLSSKTQELLKNIKDLKSDLEKQKESMDREKRDLENVVKIQVLQKQESAKAKEEKEHFLKLTEEEYQKYLREKEETERKVAEIRARIFELIGVPKAPTFGEALDLAKYVEGITGVRPALLLAVLTQESNIGKNVGQCYLKNPSTGEGVVAYNSKKVARVMKPDRDVQPFLSITKELGRNPYETLVSCPIPSVGGYGGAMGPGQFIPSTWVKYRERVKAITGKPADPWNIKDAFLATGLYLSDYGAAQQTYNAEWKAAMIYFSGSTNPRYSFYGNSVMAIAKNLQKDIDTIESVSE